MIRAESVQFRGKEVAVEKSKSELYFGKIIKRCLVTSCTSVFATSRAQNNIVTTAVQATQLI